MKFSQNLEEVALARQRTNEEDDCGKEFQRPSFKEAQAAIETCYFCGAEYCNDESIFRRVDEIELTEGSCEQES